MNSDSLWIFRHFWVRENEFELFPRDDAVLPNVMCPDKFSDVLFSQILPKFLEREQKIIFRDFSAVVGVKNAEDRPQLGFWYKFLYVKRRYKKLCEVDLAISSIVWLFYHLRNVIFTDCEIVMLNHLAKFMGFY